MLYLRILAITVMALQNRSVDAQEAAVSATHLRCEYKANPIGIDSPRPRLSWQLVSGRRGVTQKRYQIRVARTEDDLASSPTWDTGPVESDQSVHVEYDGPDLESFARYYWQVRIWDEQGEASAWSEPAFWEMGLLDPSDWTASWISSAADKDISVPQPAPMLRTEFEIEGEVASARAYVTSLGLYEAVLNGQRIGDEVFAPGWTSYDTRLQYQTYDITDLVTPGMNAVGAMLGDGWYRGHLSWDMNRNVYGDRLALLLQIRIEHVDGRVQIVGTDNRWTWSPGPIRMSDIYNGESYDARHEQPGWAGPGFDDTEWKPVEVLDHPKDILIAPAGPPIRRIEEIAPIAVIATPGGETVVDLGQNMVGRVRLSVQGEAGTTVTLRHAEVLDSDGNFYTDNLRKAEQAVSYTLRGGGVETYEPFFTFQGFRYVAVEGFPGEVTPESITGIVIHSDMEYTGTFETSKPLVNQLQHNIVWGQKGNFLDVPTDCPQRDERLGWTGDAQVFARTAAFNMNVASFFTKWLADLAADQRENGAVPWVIPDALYRRGGEALGSRSFAGSAGWGDAAVTVPWNMYLLYGDVRLLETQYPSMKAWVDFMHERAGDDLIWDGDFHFGDWLAYATDRSDYPGATTAKDLIATAYFAYSTSLLVKAAEVLGYTQDAWHYDELLAKTKEAFNAEYVTPKGRIASNTQTAYAIALAFGLLPDELEEQAADRLVADIRAHGTHISTGFLGAPLVSNVLTDHGHVDVAYDLLNQDTYPSWLYPVTMGATTIWERWDGQKPDSTFQNPGMNSFNHYAYGAVGDWMYRTMAGIDVDPEKPGYKHIIIDPIPGGGFEYAKGVLETQYGRVVSSWKIENGIMHLEVEIPPNTTATVRLPNALKDDVKESGAPPHTQDGIGDITQSGETVTVEIGSGQYAFGWELRN